MSDSKSDQPRTYLAEYRARYGTPIVRLAADLECGRNHIYHLLDPTNPTYGAHVVSSDLFDRLARYLRKRRGDVESNYLAAIGAERKAS